MQNRHCTLCRGPVLLSASRCFLFDVYTFHSWFTHEGNGFCWCVFYWCELVREKEREGGREGERGREREREREQL